jgi:hypothetical protein
MHETGHGAFHIHIDMIIIKCLVWCRVVHNTAVINTLGHATLLNFLIWKLGGMIGYKECTNTSCSLEYRHLFSGALFFRMHR